MKEDRYYSRSYSRQQKTINVVIQIVLLVLGIMWILPLMWIILTSFRAEPGSYTSYFWPKGFTLDNYMRLLLKTSSSSSRSGSSTRLLWLWYPASVQRSSCWLCPTRSAVCASR